MKFFMMVVLGLSIVVPPSVSQAFTGEGMPFKYISSCEIDLNGDQKSDKAMLIEGLSGRELIALIKTAKGYDTYVVSKDKPNMFLRCTLGSEIKESKPDRASSKVHKTPGAYLELVKSESSSVAFVFEKNSFKEIWTAD